MTRHFPPEARTHFNLPFTFSHTKGTLTVPEREPVFLQEPPALAADTDVDVNMVNNSDKQITETPAREGLILLLTAKLILKTLARFP